MSLLEGRCLRLLINDSKSGWPSFTKPIESENVVEKHDAT
jgi:hypothetical protein